MALLLCPSALFAEETTLTPVQTTVIQANGTSAQNEEVVLYKADATAWRCSQAKISGGAFSNMLANYEGSPVVITKFDASEFLAGKTLKKATLTFYSVCTVSGKNSNVQIAHIGTGWDATTATWANTNKSEILNAVNINGDGVNVKTSKKQLTQDVTEQLAASTDGTIGFGIYTKTGREQEITEIALTIEAIDASASSTYTVKYVDGEGNELKESETRSESIGASVSITDADKAAIYNADKTKKWLYVSDDAEGKTVANDASTVITVTFREAAIWNYTINAVDGEDNILKELKKGQNFEAEKFDIAYNTYVNIDGTLYKSDKLSSDGKGYYFSFTLSEDNMTKNITFNPTETTDVVYLEEAENIEGLTLTNNANTFIRSSNGASAYAKDNDVVFTTLPNGKYKIATVICDASKNAGSVWNFKAGEKNIFEFTAGSVNWAEGTSEEFELNAASTDIILAQGGGNNQGVDLIYIVKTGDAPLAEAGKTIAEFKALADNTEATLAVNNTKVTFVGGGNAYIEDETGALLLENTGLALTAGKAITGTIEGKFVNDKGLAKLVATEATANSKFTEADAEITATVITVADAAKAENVSKLVKFENVKANLDWQLITQDEEEIGFLDKYEVLNGTCPERIASIVGIIGTVSGYYQFYPVSPDSIIEASIPAATEVKSIAEMKAVEAGTEVNFVMNNVKVTTNGYSTRGYFCTIEDETGAVSVGGDMVSSIFMENGAVAGTTITGHVRGTYTVANGMPTFDISEFTGAADELTATEATIEPTEATIAGVKNAESIAKYVILKDVKMTATQEGWETFYTAAQGEETISVVDALMDRATYQGVLSKYMDEETGVVTLPDMFESVSAIVTINENGDYVLYPTAVVEKEAQEEIPVVWDFTKWSEETTANLAAEAATVVPDGDGNYPEVTPWRSYEKKGGPTEADPDRGGAAYWYGTAIESAKSLTANGTEIAETAGLLFDKMSAGALAIALNYPETTLGTYAGPAYLWIGGKNNSFVIPSVKPGSTIEIKIESHKPAEGRGVKLSVNGTVIGEAIPTTVETFRIEVPAAETETVDVKVENTNGCHIYTIGITDYTKIDTGISGINNDVKTVDGVYTINGVKVRNAGESLNGLAKGLYIIGGKKVVIK